MILDRMRAAVPWGPFDDRWYSADPSSSQTFAGFAVGPDTAARVSTVFACNSLRADTLATLPCILYRRLDNGGKERARDHRLYRVVRQRPNAWMTAADFFGFGEWHTGMRGGIVNEIRDLGRRGVELIPHHPSTVTASQLSTGRMRYEIRNPKTGEARTLLQDEALQVRDLSMNGIEGISRAALAREAIAVAAAGEAFVGGFFKNDATGRLVLEHPGTLPNKEKRDEHEQAVREAYQGWQNARRPMITYGGMKVTEIGGAKDEGFIVDPRKFQVSDVARFWRVPGFMIGLEEKSTSWGSGLGEQKQGWVDFTIRPIVTRWEQAMNRDLLFEEEQEEYFFEFLLADLLRGDLTSRTESLAVQHDHGVVSPNEWRRFENMNPRDDGDVYLETPRGAAPNRAQTPAPGPEPGPEPAATIVPAPMMADAARRIVAREGRDIRARRPDGAAARAAWYPKALAKRRDYLLSVLDPLAQLVGLDGTALADVANRVDAGAVLLLDQGHSDEGWQVMREEEVLAVITAAFQSPTVALAA